MHYKNRRHTKRKADIGFFAMLGICLIAIAVVAYVTVFSDFTKDNTNIEGNEIVDKTPEIEDNTPVITEPDDDDKPQDNDKNDDEDDAPIVEEPDGDDDDSEPVVSIPEQKNIVYSYPVIGDISKEYVVDSVVFSASLNDWRTHKGIDIVADENAKIYASADGVVEDVYYDELMGNTVVVLHSDGLRTVYSNLDKEVLVSIGQKVNTKSTVGKVGNTSAAECMDVPHLHFEMIKDGEQLDPETLLN